MRAPATTALARAIFALALLGARPVVAEVAANAADCVRFGTPKPTATFVFRGRSSPGGSEDRSERWTEVTGTIVRVSVARGKVNEKVVNRYRLRDDVSWIDSTTSSVSGVTSTTRFRPAALGEPHTRACAGRTWKIPAVAATYESGARVSVATTYAGTLRIVSLRESVTVPAGKFDCVHFSRTLATPTGQSVDHYWKSIEHGVVIR